MLNTFPFYWISSPRGLTDWHWAMPGFSICGGVFVRRNGAVNVAHPFQVVVRFYVATESPARRAIRKCSEAANTNGRSFSEHDPDHSLNIFQVGSEPIAPGSVTLDL
ncbi:hypothetical protein [Xanthomonas cucurbitae]|uniref:hypothetical protein n=1 Tax=Xanthomonas cucurbitae TaxID=56453 RepID=UPI002368D397|nr:hypothetical protein [Xanthomonas cucurbitae]WDM79930.1 hypothetical protein K6980_04200 [Xanthomonas cucurbitae]